MPTSMSESGSESVCGCGCACAFECVCVDLNENLRTIQGHPTCIGICFECSYVDDSMRGFEGRKQNVID